MNSKPVICWDNCFARPDVTLSHTESADGHPFQNLFDWRDYTLWKTSGTGEVFVKLDAGSGSTVSADTWAMAGHDLCGAGVEGMGLYYSDDDVTYTCCAGPCSPEADGVFFRKFESVTARYFKMVLPAGYSKSPAIGVLYMGTCLGFPAYPEAGFDPDSFEVEEAVQYSRTGNLLGVAQKYRRWSIPLDFSRLPASFIENEWTPFRKAHGSRPFFFVWDAVGRPESARFVRLAASGVEAPYEGPWRSLSLRLSGRAE
jgi:hypothetical protein